MQLSLKYIAGAAVVMTAVACNSPEQKAAEKTEEVITFIKDPASMRVDILADGKPFTSLFYADSSEKPVLYPIYASNGEIITRGFPINPRPNDPVDHPHHLGLWLNYENVNGLDFWNNSYAQKPERKPHFGWIKLKSIDETVDSTVGKLSYTASWNDIKNDTLLEEKTAYYFTVENGARIIDRITTLTAMQDVSMPDVKDGMLGLRVAHELELPSNEEREYRDNNGVVTKIKANEDSIASGNYITSEGITGDAVWSTRAKWCMLYGKKGGDTISIAIIDHPKNTGYPTYWHARGYGLFAANPLAPKVFDKNAAPMNFALKKGESVTFRYRVVVGANKQRLSNEEVEKFSEEFAKEQ